MELEELLLELLLPFPGLELVPRYNLEELREFLQCVVDIHPFFEALFRPGIVTNFPSLVVQIQVIPGNGNELKDTIPAKTTIETSFAIRRVKMGIGRLTRSLLDQGCIERTRNCRRSHLFRKCPLPSRAASCPCRLLASHTT